MGSSATTVRQFTGTAYILHKGHTLLIYHKKLQKWLPPGGHLEENELPHEGALREVYEETGLRVKIIEQENITIERWNACSIPRPYLCLLENIPEHNGHSAHQHVDFIFLTHPIDEIEPVNPYHHNEETLRWFNRKEIKQLQGDVEIFEETKSVLLSLLNAN